MGRADRRTAWRHLIDDGQIKIAVQTHRKCAWNRCGGHDQRIRILALRHNLQPLHDAEAMLFINDGETKLLERNLTFAKRMRSDKKIDFAGSRLLQQLLFLRPLDSPAKNAHPILKRAKDALCVDEMLFGKDLGRSHEGGLITVLYSDDNGFKCDDGLPAAHISLHQTDHGVRRLQVIDDFLQDALLRGRWMKRQNLLETLSRAIRGFEPNTSQRAALRATQRVDEFQQEELFKNQTAMKG